MKKYQTYKTASPRDNNLIHNIIFITSNNFITSFGQLCWREAPVIQLCAKEVSWSFLSIYLGLNTVIKRMHVMNIMISNTRQILSICLLKWNSRVFLKSKRHFGDKCEVSCRPSVPRSPTVQRAAARHFLEAGAPGMTGLGLGQLTAG